MKPFNSNLPRLLILFFLISPLITIAQTQFRVQKATASGIYNYTHDGANDWYKPEYAIDGKKGEGVHKLSTFHSALNGQAPWWQADLGGICDISKIKIFSRYNVDDAYEGLTNAYIMVSETKISSNSKGSRKLFSGPIEEDGEKTIEVLGNKKGRYIRIFIPDDKVYLQLGEVEIYGHSAEKKVPNNFTATTGGPNITGVWKLSYDYDDMADFNISSGATSIDLKMITGTQVPPDDRQHFYYENLNGTYGWNATEACYQKGNSRLYNVSNGTLALRWDGGRKVFSFKKGESGEGGSLADLFSKGGDADTRSLWGEWKIEGKSQKIELMGGATCDLIIKIGNNKYEMNKVSTGYPDKYSDESGSASLLFVSNTKMKLIVGNDNAMLIKAGTSGSSGGLGDLVNSNSNTSSNSSQGSSSSNNNINQTNTGSDTPLHIAAKKGEVENVKDILSVGANVNSKNANGKTALMDAMDRGNTDVAQVLLDNGANLNTKDKDNKTVLELAIDQKNEKSISFLLKNNARVSEDVLKAAVRKNDVSLLTQLIEGGGHATPGLLTEAIRSDAGSSINYLMPKVKPESEAYVLAAKNNNIDLYTELVSEKPLTNNKSIEVAIDNNYKEILSTGLQFGGNANKALDYSISKNNRAAIKICLSKKGVKKEKVIPYAVENEDEEIINDLINKYEINVDKILDKSVELNKPAIIRTALETGKTNPGKHLKTMVERDQDDLAKLMVDNGADANKGMKIAIEKSKPDLVEYFINNGQANTTNPQYIKTAAAKDYNICQLLIENGADANEGIAVAATNNQMRIVELCLENSADANLALVPAATKGYANITAVLLEAGASPDPGLNPALKGNHTETALKLIESGAKATGVIATPSAFGNTSVVKALIENGADPQNGMTAACKYGQASVLLILLENGADGNKPSYMSDAVNGLHTALIPILFEQGIDPNAEYIGGRNFLHLACDRTKSLNTVQALIDGGVSPSHADNKGDTPLHLAAKKGKENIPLFKVLVDAGADVNVQNNQGKTPTKIAKMGKTRNALKKLGGVKKVKN